MNSSNRLLLVDDDTIALNLMTDLLKSRGFPVDSASSVDNAENKLEESAYRVVITDLKMPNRSGLELLELCVKKYPETAVIIITGHGTIRNAVEALKSGAFEYLSKPVQMDELILVIQKAIGHLRLVDENRFLRKELDRIQCYYYDTSDPELQKIYQTVSFISSEDTSVLIQGESGTGKEVIARMIHDASPRSSGSFVPINCGAIPEHLIESELFGYEKGAFTGADQRTAGKLEIADGGTLFLDEVNELPMKAQVALLRFLQERVLSPLGSTRRISVNVRIITATNVDLTEKVRSHNFREDLYYRINVFPLKLPPLRDRKEDIIPLSYWFLKRFCSMGNRIAQSFSKEAERKLLDYHWPGNIRELRNCVDRATIICREPVIDAPSIILTPVREQQIQKPDPLLFQSRGMKKLREIELDYIDWILDKCDNNRTRAAELLDVSVRGLRNKLNTKSG